MARGQFDTEGFFAALDSERVSRGLTWKKVADDSGVSASTLTRMAQGKRPDVDSLASLITWSGLSANEFILGSQRDEANKSHSLARVVAQFRADPKLPVAGKEAIETALKALYTHFVVDPDE